MAYALQEKLNPALLDKFQIIPSRVRNLDPSRKRILWLHDLPEDPETAHLANGGYNQFERLVFVSNWQMQRYIERYSIPWYKCVVLRNAIEPIGQDDYRVPLVDDKINLIYHTTPHRGLDILCTVYDQIAQENPDVHLNVYSSFGVYGWNDRDKPFEPLFEFLKGHDQATYHGAVPNSEVRKALFSSDIFAYPSTWVETSCIALIEAMSAGLVCVHSNLGALYETSAGWTKMYQYQQNKRDHAELFYKNLNASIQAIRDMKEHEDYDKLRAMRAYTNIVYSWDSRIREWDTFLRGLL